MKRLLLTLAILLLLALPALALAETASTEPVRLDGSTIIDGDKIYYSGSIDGGESGVFVMNTDGSSPERISDVSAELLALANGNLLVYQYDLDTGDSALAVLLPDGALVPLGEDYPGAAVAANGRFYWGPASCAADGSDLQTYFPAEDYYNYYALAVEEDYLYYLDWSEMSNTVYSEGSLQPMGAALCRMNLTDLTSEVISGVGTRFLGIEGNLIYYTRDNFWRETDDSSEEISVDQGLFCATLDTLTETRLASYSEENNIVDSYTLVKDGVVYGMHSDYTTAAGSTTIIRVKNDGSRLPDFPVDAESYVALSGVEGGRLYLSQCSFISSEDDFIQQDRIVAIDLSNGRETVLTPDSLDMLFYSEMDPSVKAVNGRIYFAPYDMERWSICLKSMNLDGSDLRLLAHGISFAEG